ncbi:protein-glutamate methylesterase/protein-glutamine glutaminase [Nitrincola nitratireducens]|uniref:Protein-glutamate methylesterase/protein-glutamine glutaminase n=1 Tax=Nitrincola nitratireducens TaxID=1229521 RepID=W9V5N3_9GAMM|nr:chemotaxis response regulator protein-glutamate methylesterase [Nitrincola nitratireducens]EXJ12241.1 Chemotaxis response regulator protein-glutamate methylesterase [Nitrincola nitratireducens]
MSKINVLVVDDSAVVRQTLSDIINSAPDMQVCDTASDPYIAVEKIKHMRPDVITLDVEMPRMDGITFLRKIMSQHPIPVIICSSLVSNRSETHIKALEAGAVDIIAKPTLGTRKFLEESSQRICDAIRGAAQAQISKLISTKNSHGRSEKLTADAVIAASKTLAMSETTDKIIVIGASTGGTEAIRQVLEQMPRNCPAIAIVQHMPEGFTRSFADRLNSLCDINVKEAENGDSLLKGHALIAPGNRHLLIKRSGARYYVEIKDGPLVSRHRPSVDVLFRSAARYAGKNALGAILTGMGDDGAVGMLEMRESGAWTCGQDEASSVVYGMPKEALIKGGVVSQLPLSHIAAALIRESSR